ncbi:MAG: hypothetical protein K0Q79_2260 [Flavipsychrobacter sp.]|jgi:hypothetical protein|nr:hypothetical protein [Flavipsychrobacter sp.]
MVITHSVVMNKEMVMRNNVLLQGKEALSPEDLYHSFKWNYPKFFKMDKLCKWAFAGAELLLSEHPGYKELDKNRTGIVLATNHGCIDVDKRYLDTIAMPSPALFVYTLPNIMLGEICIRHGFKGAQLCMVSEQFDKEEILFAAGQLFKNNDLEACLCGWADVSDNGPDIQLFWATRN